jgi:hypothetical protein
MSESFAEYFSNRDDQYLFEQTDIPMKLLRESYISERLQYHLENNLSLSNTAYRYGSESYYALVNEVRDLYHKGLIEINAHDKFFIDSELGLEAVYHGKTVKLDSPMRSSGPKKYQVFVNSGRKNASGETIAKKVTFGDRSLSVKNYSDARRKSFLARHKCSEKKDRTTPGYWSCNVGRYAKKLGLTSSKRW